MYLDQKVSFYFDSFGNSPPKEICNFLDRNSKNKWLYNKNKYQGDLSTLCGYYCIIFLLKCPNIFKFYKLFSPCSSNNELKLKKFFKI